MDDSKAGNTYIVIDGLRFRRKHPAVSPITDEPKRLKPIQDEPKRLKPIPESKPKLPRFQSLHPQAPFPCSIQVLCEYLAQAETSHFSDCMRSAPKLVSAAFDLRDIFISRWKIALSQLISQEEQREASQKEKHIRDEAERRCKREKMEILIQQNKQNPAVAKYQAMQQFLQDFTQKCRCYTAYIAMLAPMLKFAPAKALPPAEYERADLSALQQAYDKQKRQTASRVCKLFRLNQVFNQRLEEKREAAETANYRQFHLLWGVHQVDPGRLLQRFISTSNSLNYV